MANNSNRVNVSSNDFITAWMKVKAQGGTVADVAAMVGLKKASVEVRASTYRNEKGINLPELASQGRGRKLDVDAANDLIAKLEAEAKAEAKSEG